MSWFHSSNPTRPGQKISHEAEIFSQTWSGPLDTASWVPNVSYKFNLCISNMKRKLIKKINLWDSIFVTFLRQNSRMKKRMGHRPPHLFFHGELPNLHRLSSRNPHEFRFFLTIIFLRFEISFIKYTARTMFSQPVALQIDDHFIECFKS